MKNTKARDNSGDDWKTPDWFYDKLNQKYHFDFDPCPYQADFDGLDTECVWGKSNFINPPYSRVLKEKFIIRAVEESKKGNLCVMLLPVSTPTRVFHEVILPNASSIEFVRGRLHFEQKDEQGSFVSKGAGQHDSMVVVFQGKGVEEWKN